MADPRSSPIIPPPPPPQPKSNSMMLYYGLVVVATAAVVLVLYNLIILRWCADHRPPHRSRRRQPRPTVTWRIDNSPANLVASFKYEGDGKGQDGDSCIDMWLYSHMDCPLCRSPVKAEPPPPLHRSAAAAEESEHSQEVLLGPAALI